jgi:hypothetical protein
VYLRIIIIFSTATAIKRSRVKYHNEYILVPVYTEDFPLPPPPAPILGSPLYKSKRAAEGFSIKNWHAMPARERKPTNHYDPSKEAAKTHWSTSAVAAGGLAVAAGGSAVVEAPEVVVISNNDDEYWGDDEDTVFVENLTTASRVSIK